MTPSKLLIAQRLLESAHELRAIADLMTDYLGDPTWLVVANALLHTGETAQWWANEIRAER